MQNRKLLYCLVALSLAGLSTSLTSCKKQSEVKVAQEESVQIRLQAKDLQINRAKIGAECRAHRECEAGQACIESVCKSMDHLSCRTNLDCPDYEKCFDGTCAMCAQDSDCGRGFVCSYAGVCLPNREKYIACTQASECGPGETCIEGKCASFCLTSTECGIWNMNGDALTCARSVAVPAGVCLEDRACETDDQCNGGYECYQRRCQKIICRSDADCGAKSVCHEGTCYGVECMSDGDCRDGEVCRNRQCTDECKSADDCNDAACIDGGCEKKCKMTVCPKNSWACRYEDCEQCQNDADCGDGKVCKKETQVDLIKNKKNEGDEDAQSGFSHSPEIAIRREFQSAICVECTTDAHCKDGMHCLDNECKAYECLQDADCGEGKFCASFHECLEIGKACTPQETTDGESKGFSVSVSFGGGEKAPEPRPEGGCRTSEICSGGMCIPYSATPYKCLVDGDCRVMGENAICDTSDFYYSYIPHSEGDPIPEPAMHVCKQRCEADADCTPLGGNKRFCYNHVCAYGSMFKSCQKDDQCPEGKVCSPVYGACIRDPQKRVEFNAKYENAQNPGSLKEAISYLKDMSEVESTYDIVYSQVVMCWSDADCSTMPCTNGVCGCASDSQCGEGQKCSLSGSCVCTEDKGCPNGFKCNSGSCQCNTDEVCGAGEICSDYGRCTGEPDKRELYRHGRIYEFGYGVKIDEKKAADFYQKAADEGVIDALLALGRFYIDGKGVAKDVALGKALIETAIAKHSDKKAPIASKAQNLLESLAKLEKYSEIDTSLELGKLYFEGKYVAKDVKKGVALLKESDRGKYYLAKYFEDEDIEASRTFYALMFESMSISLHTPPLQSELELRDMRVEAAHKLIDMIFDDDAGLNAYLCQEYDMTSVRSLCNVYEFLANWTDDPKAAYEFEALAREGCCRKFGVKKDFLKMAIDAGVVAASCKDDDSTCPASKWKSTHDSDGKSDGGWRQCPGEGDLKERCRYAADSDIFDELGLRQAPSNGFDSGFDSSDSDDEVDW